MANNNRRKLELDLNDLVDVYCGDIQGTYIISMQRVIYKMTEMTPTEFERRGGKASAKKWRQSIRVIDQNRESGGHGKTLGDWLVDNGFERRENKGHDGMEVVISQGGFVPAPLLISGPGGAPVYSGPAPIIFGNPGHSSAPSILNGPPGSNSAPALSFPPPPNLLPPMAQTQPMTVGSYTQQGPIEVYGVRGGNLTLQPMMQQVQQMQGPPQGYSQFGPPTTVYGPPTTIHLAPNNYMQMVPAPQAMHQAPDGTFYTMGPNSNPISLIPGPGAFSGPSSGGIPVNPASGPMMTAVMAQPAPGQAMPMQQ